MYLSPHDKESKNRLASARCHSQPLRFYHHCDKLGMLVWQDMPNGSDHSPQFEKELKGMIDAARAHPSIVMWVLFNEGCPTVCKTHSRFDEESRSETNLLFLLLLGNSDGGRPRRTWEGRRTSQLKERVFRVA
jgi:hypothetical protein